MATKWTRQKILPNDYLSSQRFDVFSGVLIFVIFFQFVPLSSKVKDAFPPILESCVSYGIFGYGCVILCSRIKHHYEQSSSFYSGILSLISALWLFFNMCFYFGFVGFFLFALLALPCGYLHFIRKKEDFALLYLAIISFFCLFAVIGAMWIAIVLMCFFGVVIKIIQSDDSSVRFKEDISVHFLLGTRKTFGIFQGTGGVVFVYLYVYANKWIKIPLALQLMLWGVFLWHLTMTAIFYYAILECHKDIVFSEVDTTIQTNRGEDDHERV